MSDILIKDLERDQEVEAARVLAQAFVTNPLHIRVFGPEQINANEAFFSIGLRAMKGRKLAAMDGPRIVGVIHWVSSPGCQFSAVEKVGMLPGMMRALGVGPTLKVTSWLSIWSKQDPSHQHSHLGPIGVLPEAQGRGIGRRLMERYCTEIDGRRMAGYLETDRPRNVDFYKAFGFDVTGMASIHGVVNYFMRRSEVADTSA